MYEVNLSSFYASLKWAINLEKRFCSDRTYEPRKIRIEKLLLIGKVYRQQFSDKIELITQNKSHYETEREYEKIYAGNAFDQHILRNKLRKKWRNFIFQPLHDSVKMWKHMRSLSGANSRHLLIQNTFEIEFFNLFYHHAYFWHLFWTHLILSFFLPFSFFIPFLTSSNEDFYENPGKFFRFSCQFWHKISVVKLYLYKETIKSLNFNPTVFPLKREWYDLNRKEVPWKCWKGKKKRDGKVAWRWKSVWIWKIGLASLYWKWIYMAASYTLR